MFNMHVPVPPVAGQRWYPALHAIPHVLAVHTAAAWGSDGAAHVEHPAIVPHCMVLSLGKHPLVAGHMWVPAPHMTPQAPLTQAVPVGHGVQSVPSMVPQVADALLLTQRPLQRCQPASQSGTHVPAVLHVTLPLSGGGTQTVHELPHELGLVLLLATQVVVAPLPHG